MNRVRFLGCRYDAFFRGFITIISPIQDPVVARRAEADAHGEVFLVDVSVLPDRGVQAERLHLILLAEVFDLRALHAGPHSLWRPAGWGLFSAELVFLVDRLLAFVGALSHRDSFGAQLQVALLFHHDRPLAIVPDVFSRQVADLSAWQVRVSARQLLGLCTHGRLAHSTGRIDVVVSGSIDRSMLPRSELALEAIEAHQSGLTASYVLHCDAGAVVAAEPFCRRLTHVVWWFAEIHRVTIDHPFFATTMNTVNLVRPLAVGRHATVAVLGRLFADQPPLIFIVDLGHSR